MENDKLDEWLNKAFTGEDNTSNTTPQPKPQPPSGGQILPRPQNQGQGQRTQQARPHPGYKAPPSGVRQGQPQRSQSGRQAQPAGAHPQQARQTNPGTARQPQPQRQPNPQRSQQSRSGQAPRTQQPRPQQKNPAQATGRQPQANGRNAPRSGKSNNYGDHRPSTGKHRRMPATKSQPTGVQKGQIVPGRLKMIPLGGLNEVGKNMMALEYENDIIILDMGLEFPSEDMMGIDYVIPDVSYLEENKKRIRAIVITHGHLDHIGGIPYILPRLDFPPLYSCKLTIGLIQKRIEEFKQEKLAKLITVEPLTPMRFGQFVCTFFRVAHSIPDSTGVIIDTPAGKFVHTGDFKFDETPARNLHMADIATMESLGNQNVLGLFCESTNALKPGHSMSEKEVGITLEKIIEKAPGRVIIASFSSQIGRIQQIIDGAHKHQRKMYISGRSMTENMAISAKLGYLSFPKDMIFDIRKYKNAPDKETLILTTGSQGESVSALTRIAANEHPHVHVQKGDTIVLSSSPIVGNEKAINSVINNLTMLGADVIHNQIADVHTSGHGKQDELARMVNMIKPRYLIPVHGEYYMRQGLAKIAVERCNMRPENVIMLQNGDVLVSDSEGVRKSDEKVETKYILIDGLGEGQMDSQVQMDREIMSQNGALVVLVYVNSKNKVLQREPEVVSRGFIYMHESDEITREISRLAGEAYRNIRAKNTGANRQDIKKYIRQTIDKYTHAQLERRPLIIPLIIE